MKNTRKKAPKRKKPKAQSADAARMRQLRMEKKEAEIRRKIAKVHEVEHLIAGFEKNELPVFEDWVNRRLGKEKERFEHLQRELVRHEQMLEEIEDRWMDGDFRTRREACEAVFQEYEARSRGGERDHESDDGDPFTSGQAPPFSKEDVPSGFLADLMFAQFMEEVRGVDVGSMSSKAYEKARAEFQESFKHAAEGNQCAFEKALLRAGADDSEKNKKAVNSVFRRLVKRLHPDQNPDLGDDAKEIWTEVLDARQSLDRQALELLEIRWMIEQNEPLAPEHGPLLRYLLEEVDDRLYNLEARMITLRDHPMWGRKGRLPTKRWEAEARREFEFASISMAEELEDLKRRLDRLRRAPARKRISRAKKKAPAKRKLPVKKKGGAKKKVAAKKSMAAEKESDRPKAKKSPPVPKRGRGTKKASASRSVGARDRSARQQGEFDF